MSMGEKDIQQIEMKEEEKFFDNQKVTQSMIKRNQQFDINIQKSTKYRHLNDNDSNQIVVHVKSNCIHGWNHQLSQQFIHINWDLR